MVEKNPDFAYDNVDWETYIVYYTAVESQYIRCFFSPVFYQENRYSQYVSNVNPTEILFNKTELDPSETFEVTVQTIKSVINYYNFPLIALQ